MILRALTVFSLLHYIRGIQMQNVKCVDESLSTEINKILEKIHFYTTTVHGVKLCAVLYRTYIVCRRTQGTINLSFILFHPEEVGKLISNVYSIATIFLYACAVSN